MMFGFLQKLMNKKMSTEEIASLLKTNPELIKKFEESYNKNVLIPKNESDNLFDHNSREASLDRAEGHKDDVILTEMVEKIVAELLSQSHVMEFDGEKIVYHSPKEETSLMLVGAEEVNKLPLNSRPQLTGNLVSRDISEPSYIALLEMYKNYLSKDNPEKVRMHSYHMFRQGLDILDLDEITYQIIGMNKNSMGYWLPAIVPAVVKDGFFKIPKTKVLKVPLSLLQLTRKDYMSLNNTTMKIVDDYIYKVFGLKDDKEYFVKTGTYSSKFDFRNAHVVGENEVRTLGEYLLFIHYQALCMAHYDLSPNGKKPIIYGVSTTNEWCVREFIQDKENAQSIYSGLPLHTEYRVFVDFDTDEVLGIHNYWDSEVMKKRFAEERNMTDKHDAITFSLSEERLVSNYEKNKDMIVAKIANIIKDIDLEGQWSIDVMQNGDDFHIIDMALADSSAFYKESVPENKRKHLEEQWLPKLN